MAHGQPFEIGSRIRIRRLESGTKAHITRVEDITENWVAIQRPIHHYEPVRLYPGETVELTVVRTEPPAGIFNATTVVIGETRQRLPLVRIQLPEGWKRAQLREYFRVPVTRPIRVRPITEEEDEPWLEGVSRDLSGGGCQVVLPETLDPEQPVEVELDLPDGTYRMRGTVRRITEEMASGQLCTVAGIRFDDVPERQREEIIRYAFERQIELRKKGMT